MSIDGNVHYPQDPDHFVFDEEVAQVFDDMAVRSIPMYEDVHRFAAHIALQHIADVCKMDGGNRTYRVLDVGASTGAFFRAMYARKLQAIYPETRHIEYHAVDPCVHMLKRLERSVPYAHTYPYGAEEVSKIGEYFDIVNMSYVMQFIPVHLRTMVLCEIRSVMIPGSLLFMAQKEKLEIPLIDGIMHEEYMQFRRGNGYSQSEISAKNKALANSMWTDTWSTTVSNLTGCGFSTPHELTRNYQFSSLVCRADSW